MPAAGSSSADGAACAAFGRDGREAVSESGHAARIGRPCRTAGIERTRRAGLHESSPRGSPSRSPRWARGRACRRDQGAARTGGLASHALRARAVPSSVSRRTTTRGSLQAPGSSTCSPRDARLRSRGGLRPMCFKSSPASFRELQFAL